MNLNPIQQLPGPSPASVLESSGEQKMPAEGYFQERQAGKPRSSKNEASPPSGGRPRL